MTIPVPEPGYSFSFLGGALLVTETLAVARLLQHTHDWKVVAKEVRVENLLRQRTLASTTRLLREIRHRLAEFGPDELDFLVESDPRDQRLLLFLAICRHYRFVREFVSVVLRSKSQVNETQLFPGELIAFLDDLSVAAPEVERLTDRSRSKVRQVMLRILAEAGLIDSTARCRLQRPVPSRALVQMIAKRDSKQLRWLLFSDHEIREITC